MNTPPFFVYALGRSSRMPRALAGPFPQHAIAAKLLPKVREIGVARHYVSPHSDAVFVAGCYAELGEDTVGILNRWLPEVTEATNAEV